MSEDIFNVRCSCGGELTAIDPKPDDVIVCPKCGAGASCADLQKQAETQLKEFAEKTARDVFGKQ